MKKVLLLLIIIQAVFLTVMCAGLKNVNKTDNISVRDKITTSYYDLPGEYSDRMKTLLKTGNLTELDSNSFNVILSFMKKKISGISGPHGSWISTNYFWNIYNALPPFVSGRERHQGYYRDEQKPAFDDQLLAYACYRLDRSPENLSRIFNAVKPALKILLPVEQYNAVGAREYVSGLIGCYTMLSQTPDAEKKLSGFYSSVYTPEGSVRKDAPKKVLEKYNNSAYGFSGYDLSEMLSGVLKIDRYSSYYASPWLSFWMRRNREGNMDEVYRILREVETMYQ